MFNCKLSTAAGCVGVCRASRSAAGRYYRLCGFQIPTIGLPSAPPSDASSLPSVRFRRSISFMLNSQCNQPFQEFSHVAPGAILEYPCPRAFALRIEPRVRHLLSFDPPHYTSPHYLHCSRVGWNLAKPLDKVDQ